MLIVAANSPVYILNLSVTDIVFSLIYYLARLPPERPFQTVVSDMTAFWVGRQYHELTLYMDLFNNEIVA